MSKSLARVERALVDAGLAPQIREMPGETRTARQAADMIGCALDQIVKSIVFSGADSGRIVLFLTAGGNSVQPGRASALAGEPLARADPAEVRAQTGFAIGGVAPVGHKSAVPAFLDRRLLDFDLVWAAAGTPRHVFSCPPAELLRITPAEPGDFT